MLHAAGRASGTSTYIISALLVTAAFICTGVTASAVNFDNLIEDAVESLNTRQPHLHARRRLMGSGNTGSLSNLKRLDTQHSRLLQQGTLFFTIELCYRLRMPAGQTVCTVRTCQAESQ